MELSREDSIRITIEEWTWAAETGALKYKWPGWEKYGRMLNWCPFCAYGLEQMQSGGVEEVCGACPYYQKFGGCCATDSPYDLWAHTRTARTRKKYAALFLEQLKQL